MEDYKIFGVFFLGLKIILCILNIKNWMDQMKLKIIKINVNYEFKWSSKLNEIIFYAKFI